MKVTRCDVPDCGVDAPFARRGIDIPVLSEAMHDRETVDVPKIVMKKHDLCEAHYQMMLMRNLFSSETDDEANYRGIMIPKVTR